MHCHTVEGQLMLAPKSSGFRGLGNEVSRCASDRNVWGACAGWLSPKRCRVTSRGDEVSCRAGA